MINEKDDAKCFHCNQILTSEAREYIEKTGGSLPTPEQVEAKRKQKEADEIARNQENQKVNE